MTMIMIIMMIIYEGDEGSFVDLELFTLWRNRFLEKYKIRIEISGKKSGTFS